MTVSAPPLKELALSVIPAVQRAGAAIMDIYHSNQNVRYKADRSPVTDADHASEDLILEALHDLAPDIPAVAEEQLAAGNSPDVKRCFFLIDPLDGTKEFIKVNGEFTINVALVEAGARSSASSTPPTRQIATSRSGRRARFASSFLRIIIPRRGRASISSR